MTWEPLLEDAVDVAAPPDRVWALVSDLERMAEWSPQVTSTRVKGEGGVTTGTRFTNRNVHGELEWTTHGEVVRWTPGRELAFRIEENHVVWSFGLTPTATGTRLVQRRETPDGISDLSLELTEGFMGGQEAFTAALRAGMRETLERVRDEAEAG